MRIITKKMYINAFRNDAFYFCMCCSVFLSLSLCSTTDCSCDVQCYEFVLGVIYCFVLLKNNVDFVADSIYFSVAFARCIRLLYFSILISLKLVRR